MPQAAASDDRLARLRAGVLSCPLTKPYELSFTTLTEFESVWVIAEFVDGRIGLGEAVALPGYAWETTSSVHETVRALCENATGLTVGGIVERCLRVRAEHPFAASAVMTALELPKYLHTPRSGSGFPISVPLAGDWEPARIRRTMEEQLATGRSFLKVKVGRDLARDIRGTRTVLEEFPDFGFRVVFDANQAYSVQDAIVFARTLKEFGGDRLQWFEQPVDRQDWPGMQRVCEATGVPIVLDEAIYDEADLKRARTIGAHGVKLKLFKNFGIDETLRLARAARALGLVVVFGNGVATDLGNLGEYLTLSAAADVFDAPSESSGFAKLRSPLLGAVLTLDRRGRFRCEVDAAGLERALSAFSAAQPVA